MNERRFGAIALAAYISTVWLANYFITHVGHQSFPGVHLQPPRSADAPTLRHGDTEPAGAPRRDPLRMTSFLFQKGTQNQ